MPGSLTVNNDSARMGLKEEFRARELNWKKLFQLEALRGPFTNPIHHCKKTSLCFSNALCPNSGQAEAFLNGPRVFSGIMFWAWAFTGCFSESSEPKFLKALS